MNKDAIIGGYDPYDFVKPKEQPKPAPFQSADVYWCEECECVVKDANHRCEQWSNTVRIPKEFLTKDRAAQRQAGREEVAEKLSAFLSVCEPVVGKTLADIYDPESTGCLFCPNCAKVCPYLISLAKGEPHAAG